MRRIAVALLALITVGPDTKLLTKGNAEFAIELHRRLAGRGGNVFFSPHSISTALALTASGARGKTAAEMTKALRLPFEGAQLGKAYSELTGSLENQHDVELRIANALWIANTASVRKGFLDQAARDYGANAERLDFHGAPAASRKRINGWISQKTAGRIKDLLGPDTIQPLTRLVITNAVYMKGRWESPFSPRSTMNEPFHIGNANASVPMMHQKESFPFLHADGVRVLEMPYAGKKLSMVIVLPDEVNGLAAVEKSLTADTLAAWLDRLQNREVIVSVPKFRSSARYSLVPDLKELGMSLAFKDDGSADFSGIASNESLYISDVVHQAWIDVTEEGTEAAAATAVIAVETSVRIAPPPEVFKADHPFLFLIRDRATGEILFLGRMQNPAAK